MRKAAITLTLATNSRKVVIACENIAFAMEMQEEEMLFTRVFLKTIAVEDTKWIDVQESPEKIARIMA